MSLVAGLMEENKGGAVALCGVSGGGRHRGRRIIQAGPLGAKSGKPSLTSMQVNHHHHHHDRRQMELPLKQFRPDKISDTTRVALNGLHRLLVVALLIALEFSPQASGFKLSKSFNQRLNPFAAEPLFAGGEKPRLIPLVLAESGYSENSSVNVLCTVSQGHHESLTFDWFKDGQLLLASNEAGQVGGGLFGADSKTEEFGGRDFKPTAPQIEKHSDHSLLRIARVQSHHSGRYTCSAKNQFGQDSSSVNLIVNGNYIVASAGHKPGD